MQLTAAERKKKEEEEAKAKTATSRDNDRVDATNTGSKPKRRRRGRGKGRDSRKNTSNTDREDEGSNGPTSPQDLSEDAGLNRSHIGLTKKTYLPLIGDETGYPAIILQATSPNEASFAWSTSAAISVDLMQIADSFIKGGTVPQSSATDGANALVTTNRITTEIYPHTRAAAFIQQDIWPTYNALFQSSLRDNVDVKFRDFMVIMGNVHYIQASIVSMLVLLDLTATAQNEPVSQQAILANNLGVKLGAYKAALKARIIEIVRKASWLPALPGVMGETAKQLTPYINPLTPNTLTVPVFKPLMTEVIYKNMFETQIDRIHKLILNLVGYYSDEISIIKAFIPSTLATSGCMLPREIKADVERGIGFYNNSVNRYDHEPTQFVAVTKNTGVSNSIPIQTEKLTEADARLGLKNPQTPIATHRDIVWSKTPNVSEKLHTSHYYTLAPEPEFGEFRYSQSYINDAWNDVGHNIRHTLYTSHMYGTPAILSEDTREWAFLSYVNSVPTGLELIEALSGTFTYPFASNWWRKFGNKSILRASTATTMTYAEGFKEARISISDVDYLMKTQLVGFWSVTGMLALDTLQSGKFVAVADPRIQGVLD